MLSLWLRRALKIRAITATAIPAVMMTVVRANALIVFLGPDLDTGERKILPSVYSCSGGRRRVYSVGQHYTTRGTTSLPSKGLGKGIYHADGESILTGQKITLYRNVPWGIPDPFAANEA